MKIKVSVKKLQEGLKTVNPASAISTTTPILQNVLINVLDGELILTCTNLEITIEHKITEGLEVIEKGSILVPMRIFISYIGLLDEDFIEIEKTGDEGIKITSGSGSIKVKGFDSNSFPLTPKFTETKIVSMEQKEFKKAINHTIFSSAQQSIRPTLAGINIYSKNNELIFASTDTFRLSEYISTNPSLLELNNISSIIPNKTAYITSGLLKDNTDIINLIFDTLGIKFSFGNTNIYSKILNSNFPSYSSFFPNESDITNEVIILKSELIQTIKKINLISKEDSYNSVLIISKEKIIIKTNETQIGNCNIDLNGEIKGNGITVGFNSEYLLEVLGIIEEDYIKISFSGEVRPIFIRGLEKDKYKHIIMPLKINN